MLFEFEFVKKSSPILQHQGEKYLLNITFFTGFSHSGRNIFFINQKGIKGRYTTIQHLIIFMFITLHHENPNHNCSSKEIIIYLFSKGLKMMMIYKTCWGEHLSYFYNYIMCDIYECEFKLVGRKMANLNERGEYLLLKLTPPQGWHIVRIKFKKSSLVDKIGFNWRKLDKSGENWRKLILTIGGECKGQVF